MATTNNFDQLMQSLESGVESIAKTSLSDYLNNALQDGENAISSIKSNIEQWAVEAEKGSLTYQDLAFLTKGNEAVNEMTALKESGLSAIRLDEFKNNIINLVLDTVFSFIKV